MTEKSGSNDLLTARVFKIILVTMAVIYGVGLIGYLATRGVRLIKGLSDMRDTALLVVNLSLFVETILTVVIYFGIFYNLNCLIVMLIKSEPFDPANPKRIRNVARGAFSLAILNAGADLLRGFFAAPGIEGFISDAIGQGFRTVLFGVGILLIAKVFEAGVKLKQDQDLTV